MVCSSVCIFTIKHALKEAVFELGFKKFLETNSGFINFLFAFRQTLLKCSSNFNSLSIDIHKSLTTLVFHILLISFLAQKCSNLFFKIISFIRIQFYTIFSNHLIKMMEL